MSQVPNKVVASAIVYCRISKSLTLACCVGSAYALSKCKYGVQLGTAAAGTFNLNCSYLGIPCIGYDNLNTQKYLHPQLSVADGDISSARVLASKLKSDEGFYLECSKETQKLYNSLYSEEKYKKKLEEILTSLYCQY